MTQNTSRAARWRMLSATAAVAVAMFVPGIARAATFTAITDLVMTGPSITLKIQSGSTVSTLSTTSTTFTVVTGPADSFVVRYPNPAGKMTNNSNISECNIVSGGDNEITVGPDKNVTFTPSATSCGSGGSGGGGSSTPASVTVLMPNGGQTFSSGSSQTVQWQTNGGSISTIRIMLSTDGGATYATTVASNESNDGVYTWTVPSLATTVTTGRVKVEALNGSGAVSASDASDSNFTITGTGTTAPPVTAPPVTTPPTTTPPVTTPAPASDKSASGVFRAVEAIANNPSINDDKGLAAVLGVVAKCTANTLIKGSLPTVYYCGANAKRFVFPNEATFKSWFADFKGVKVLSDADLASIPLGGNATYKPGVRMVKITTDPKVYAVSRGGLLRWVTTESVAKTLYGLDWNKKIDDVPDSFFVNYKLGPDITSADVDPTTAPPTVTPPSSSSVATCSTSTTFSADLSAGISHAQVLPLQELLKCLGHISAGVTLTGNYGNATTAAVQAFQQSKGVPATGTVGPTTRAELNKFTK